MARIATISGGRSVHGAGKKIAARGPGPKSFYMPPCSPLDNPPHYVAVGSYSHLPLENSDQFGISPIDPHTRGKSSDQPNSIIRDRRTVASFTPVIRAVVDSVPLVFLGCPPPEIFQSHVVGVSIWKMSGHRSRRTRSSKGRKNQKVDKEQLASSTIREINGRIRPLLASDFPGTRNPFQFGPSFVASYIPYAPYAPVVPDPIMGVAQERQAAVANLPLGVVAERKASRRITGHGLSSSKARVVRIGGRLQSAPLSL